MEEFDLVDSNDNVIGVTNKKKAHALGEIHRIVAVFVFDTNGNIILQEHLKTNNKYDNSIGGHILRGESYDNVARREAEEELGITSPLSHVTTFLSDDGWGHMFGLYEVVAPKSWKFTPSEDVEKIVVMPIPEVVSMMNTNPQKFTKGFLWTMYKYLEAKKLPYIIDSKILFL